MKREIFWAIPTLTIFAFLCWPNLNQVSAVNEVSEEVAVTAVVAPQTRDIEFSLTSLKTNLDEDEEVEFTISYRSLLAQTKPFQIEANWDKGKIQGSDFNYLDVLEYVVGSATTSRDGTGPTVNLQAKKITWNIAGLAPSVWKNTVSFKLRSRSDLPTDKKIDVSIMARGKIVNTPIPEQKVSLVIQKVIPSAEPTPTPTPTPGLPAPPTPPLVVPLTFGQVSLREVTDSEAVIFFTTSKKTVSTLSYGEKPNLLDKKITGLTYQDRHLVRLGDLTPQTDYYFQILATDDGEKITSDVFSFTTSSVLTLFEVKKGGYSLTWRGLILNPEQSDFVIVPVNKPVTFTLKLTEPEKISAITTKFQNAQVLGLATLTTQPPIEETRLIEVVPSLFSAKILSPARPGRYQAVLEIKDIFGNFYSKILPHQIAVSPPLRVIDRENNEPIENAQVQVLKYEKSLKRYSSLPEKFALDKYTNDQGHLDLALPTGRYLLEVSAIGYDSIEQKLALGFDSLSYPTIFLQPRFSIKAKLAYYLNSLAAIHQFLSFNIEEFFSSQRSRGISSISLGLILILSSLVTLSLRMHQNTLGLIVYFVEEFWRKIKKMLRLKDKEKTFYLHERNNYHKAISGAVLYLISPDNHLLGKAKADLTGKIRVDPKKLGRISFPLKIMLYRHNYYAYPYLIDQPTWQTDPIPLYMAWEELPRDSLASFIHWLHDLFFIFISDLLVLLSLFFTFFFARYQGIAKSWHLILATFFIALLWLAYVHQIWRLRRS